MISNRVIGSADTPARETFRVVLAAWTVVAALVTVLYGSVIGWALLVAGWVAIAAAARLVRRLSSTSGIASDWAGMLSAPTGSRP